MIMLVQRGSEPKVSKHCGSCCCQTTIKEPAETDVSVIAFGPGFWCRGGTELSSPERGNVAH